MTSDPIIVPFRQGPFWNLSYLVGVPGGAGFVVDPAWDVRSIVERADELGIRITSAFATHGHHDHIHGLGELVAATGANVFAHEADAALVAAECGGGVETFADEMTVAIGAKSVRLVHGPGHTRGSMVAFVGGRLFTGDTLSTSGPGRHGAYEGASDDLRATLERFVFEFGPDVLVHPGHDAGPTLSAPLGGIAGIERS